MADLQNVIIDPNKAQYDAAKYGGSTPAGKLGGLLDVILPMYQALAPNAPAARMAMAGRQAWNLNQYNKAVMAQQLAEQQRKDNQRAGMTEIYQRLGLPILQDRNGNIINYEPDQLKQMAESVGNAQGVEGLARMGRREDPNFGGLTPLDQARQAIQTNILTPDMESQQGEATLNQINQANPYQLDNGARIPIGPDGMPALPANVLPAQPGGPGLGSMQQPFQTGAQMTAPPLPPPLTPIQRFQSGVYGPAVAQVISGATQKETGRHNVVGEKETNRHNVTMEGETGRHNRANESIGRTNAQAHMISANKAGSSGRAPTLLELMSPEQRAAYIARMASGSSAKKKLTPADMKAMTQLRQTYNNEAGGIFQNPAKAAAAAQMYNTMAEQFGMDPIGGYAPTPAPFKNTAPQKLQQAGTVGAKYGVKY